MNHPTFVLLLCRPSSFSLFGFTDFPIFLLGMSRANVWPVIREAGGRVTDRPIHHVEFLEQMV